MKELWNFQNQSMAHSFWFGQTPSRQKFLQNLLCRSFKLLYLGKTRPVLTRLDGQWAARGAGENTPRRVWLYYFSASKLRHIQKCPCKSTPFFLNAYFLVTLRTHLLPGMPEYHFDIFKIRLCNKKNCWINCLNPTEEKKNLVVVYFPLKWSSE